MHRPKKHREGSTKQVVRVSLGAYLLDSEGCFVMAGVSRLLPGLGCVLECARREAHGKGQVPSNRPSRRDNTLVHHTKDLVAR